MTKGIITKTGNSYAIRVPKHYITDNNLKLGDKVELNEPLEEQLSKQRSALKALVTYGKNNPGKMDIDEIVEWQREQRRSSDPWDEIAHDDIAR